MVAAGAPATLGISPAFGNAGRRAECETAVVRSPDLERRTRGRLVRAGCVAADEEAATLVGDAPDEATVEAWVVRRERGEPLAWIVGWVAFLGRPVHVDPGVYVPRAQSEALAERVIEATPGRGRVADLCTGSGAVGAAVHRARPEATVVATDVDPRAVRCARANGVTAVVADLDAGLRSGGFDVVCAVAPYVPTGELHLLPSDVLRHEPRRALDGGADGLDVVRRVVAGAARLLRPGGWLVTEIGGDQDGPVGEVLAVAGFGEPVYWFDDDGDLRGVAARLEGRS